ncbi:MurR/RpiR family transcriptional regulator [uncultured Agathobaculum sp.]|uniref:MurR/RpiR family transcriptional regulator n=1 Tax=uncultured Agathobaculum sp. TaxID=2048140 RepID=UPI002635292B|nr:MurR/RpiR family transcriptional regulator [uncultured Agathobaculum sp.]
MNLIDLSKRYLLNETEHRVLECILRAVEHGDAKVNIRAIAQQSFVSTTTVIKLSKKLGYQGYSDMMYSLRRHSEAERDAAAGIDLTSILETVDTACIEAFADELLRCRNRCIFIVGLGFSTIASSYFMRRLATLGILAYDGAPVDMMRGGNEPSLTIILSKSGETRDLVDIALHAQTLHHKLYTITAHGDSTLARMSDNRLVIRTGGSVAYNVPDFFIGRTIILFEYILSRLVDRLQQES